MPAYIMGLGPRVRPQNINVWLFAHPNRYMSRFNNFITSVVAARRLDETPPRRMDEAAPKVEEKAPSQRFDDINGVPTIPVGRDDGQPTMGRRGINLSMGELMKQAKLSAKGVRTNELTNFELSTRRSSMSVHSQIANSAGARWMKALNMGPMLPNFDAILMKPPVVRTTQPPQNDMEVLNIVANAMPQLPQRPQCPPIPKVLQDSCSSTPTSTVISKKNPEALQEEESGNEVFQHERKLRKSKTACTQTAANEAMQQDLMNVTHAVKRLIGHKHSSLDLICRHGWDHPPPLDVLKAEKPKSAPQEERPLPPQPKPSPTTAPAAAEQPAVVPVQRADDENRGIISARPMKKSDTACFKIRSAIMAYKQHVLRKTPSYVQLKNAAMPMDEMMEGTQRLDNIYKTTLDESKKSEEQQPEPKNNSAAFTVAAKLPPNNVGHVFKRSMHSGRLFDPTMQQKRAMSSKSAFEKALAVERQKVANSELKSHMRKFEATKAALLEGKLFNEAPSNAIIQQLPRRLRPQLKPVGAQGAGIGKKVSFEKRLSEERQHALQMQIGETDEREEEEEEYMDAEERQQRKEEQETVEENLAKHNSASRRGALKMYKKPTREDDN